MNQPEDAGTRVRVRQRRLAHHGAQIGPLMRDLSYPIRLQVLVVLGGITLAGLIVLVVALIAALLRWLF